MEQITMKVGLLSVGMTYQVSTAKLLDRKNLHINLNEDFKKGCFEFF